TPFLHLLPPRLKAALYRLKNSIWTLDPRPLPVRASTPTRNHTSFHNRPPTPHPIENLPHFWGKPFEQRWWQIEFPSHLLSSYSHLCWKDQAEATLYLDGFPSGGFDPAHHFVPLKPNFKEAIIESYCTQAAIWVPGSSSKINSEGSRFEGAYLAKKNPIAWQNYFDFSVLFDLARWLASRDPNIPNQNSLESSLFYRHEWHEADPILRYLIHHLDLAVELWETNGPLAMSKKLREIFDHLSQPLPNLHATTIGHAHIDLVWLWPEDITEAKLVHTFSTVERLLDQYPEFIFSHSQPAAYRLLKKRSPELYNQVLSRIQQSRWEPVGALEVEADTFLPTGEALARSFLLGQQQFQNISGYKSLVLWLPDSFGFSASIPTLMAEFDVPFFFSAKLAWSESSRFPYTSFRWRGMDGSEVIAHLPHDYAAAYNRMG
ncbi:MAG: hypothetical protein NZL93_05870, partial [Chthoniobacterales bacterium]|nr:hypothetical protein [Chthoniobacterales bacterium]